MGMNETEIELEVQGKKVTQKVHCNTETSISGGVGSSLDGNVHYTSI